jgi:phospholipase/lecithinase/hemolysin
MRTLLGGLALGAIAAVGCSSATPATPTRATTTAARQKSTFGQSLSLGMSFGKTITARDTSAMAAFALTNNGPSTFDGCFGPAWGVSVIVEGGHDAGHLVRVEHPSCDEKFSLLPGQKITWSRKVPLSNLRAGTAKVTGWVKVVNPAACDPSYGCRDVSVATPLMTMAIGER